MNLQKIELAASYGRVVRGRVPARLKYTCSMHELHGLSGMAAADIARIIIEAVRDNKKTFIYNCANVDTESVLVDFGFKKVFTYSGQSNVSVLIGSLRGREHIEVIDTFFGAAPVKKPVAKKKAASKNKIKGREAKATGRRFESDREGWFAACGKAAVKNVARKTKRAP